VEHVVTEPAVCDALEIRRLNGAAECTACPIHRAPTPHQSRPASGGVLRAQTRCRPWGGRGNVAAYEADLDLKLTDLASRVHRGAYRALPSRRTYIPKADGSQRPLAVAALEDKIVQRATAEVLNCIFEEDFLGFSYGFRPGRGQHNALDALCVGITSKKVNFILDADIRSFFDEVSKEWVVRFVEHRVVTSRIVL